MEASRIMNLYQFIQLYHDITSQAAEVLSAEGATRDPSAQLPSTDSCQASMWMGRYTTHLSPHSPERKAATPAVCPAQISGFSDSHMHIECVMAGF